MKEDLTPRQQHILTHPTQSPECWFSWTGFIRGWLSEVIVRNGEIKAEQLEFWMLMLLLETVWAPTIIREQSTTLILPTSLFTLGRQWTQGGLNMEDDNVQVTCSRET